MWQACGRIEIHAGFSWGKPEGKRPHKTLKSRYQDNIRINREEKNRMGGRRLD
jgi:hypothetical protein